MSSWHVASEDGNWRTRDQTSEERLVAEVRVVLLEVLLAGGGCIDLLVRSPGAGTWYRGLTELHRC